MPLTTITRKLEWDAGHRVLGHEGKCARLHGHRYVTELTVTAPDLDKLGRVIDFSVLKSVVGGWVDKEWDHNMMLHPEDPLVELYLASQEAYTILGDLMTRMFQGKSPYVMRNGNPTAENIARELCETATELLVPHGITVLGVTVWETPNCKASYTTSGHGTVTDKASDYINSLPVFPEP